jgi:hypothetical protein
MLGKSWAFEEVTPTQEGINIMKLIVGFSAKVYFLNWKYRDFLNKLSVQRIPIEISSGFLYYSNYKIAVVHKIKAAGFFWRERRNKESQFGRVNRVG